MSNNIFLYNGEWHKFGAERLPEVKEKNTLDWVEWGTDDDWKNQQPQYYDYLSKTSPKNGAILNAKNRYVYGKGLKIDDTAPIHLELSERTGLEGWIKGFKKRRVLKKLIKDRNKYNGFTAEVVFQTNKKKIDLHYIPFKNVRVSKKEYDKEGNLEPIKYFYTSDWSKGGRKPERNPDFEVFEPFEWDETTYKEGTRYLIYYKGDDYEDEYYPLPDYISGVPYISADCDVASFVKNNTAHGFTAGYLVNFYGIDPDSDQKKEISDQLDMTFTSPEKAGKVVKSFNQDKESGIQIEPLADNGQDGRYSVLNNQIRDEIFTAHTTSPLVVGMKGDNGFNNNADEKRVAVEDFTESFVVPVQDIFEELVNSVLEFNEIKGKVEIQRIDPIKPTLPVESLFDVATKEELRSIYRGSGYDLSDEIVEEPTQQQLKEINLRFEKNEDELLAEAFSKYGTDEEFIELDVRPLKCKDTFDAQSQGEAFKYEFANKLENAVLSLIATNNAIKAAELSNLLKVDTKTINEALTNLEQEGLVSGGEVTDKGLKQVQENEIFVVYKYALREDAAPLKGGESRPFCQRMMSMSQSRSWTIQDIQLISAQRGYDVFARRGGWYTLPNTDIHRPFCRHQWIQRLVRKK